MRWRPCAVTAVLFFCMGAVLCSLSTAASKSGGGGENILRYALHTSKLGSLDPHFARGSQDATYTDLVFNSLLRYRPGDARQIEPDLARELPRFQLIDHRQVWTVSLRKGIAFHGSPFLPAHELTAGDVVFSLTKAGNPETCAYSGLYQGMTFDIIDDYTLTITLEKPVSPLFFFPRLANWKGGVILSQKAVEKIGYDKFLEHPVGTGPFRFKSYTVGGCLELTANPRYFRGPPKLAGVNIYFMPDNREREAALLSGQMDVIYGVGEPGWLEKMQAVDGVVMDVFGPGYTGMLHFNTSMPPLDDIRVRQAIIFAIHRRALMNATSPRLVSPVYGPISTAVMPGGMDNDLVESLGLKFGADLSRAKALMAEAGLVGGFDIEVPVSEKRLYRQTYERLKTELAKINVRMTLKAVTHSLYHKLIRENISPIVLYFTVRPDADSYLRGFFHSDSIVKTGKTPHTNFSNYKGVDRLLDNALLAIDPGHQIQLWEQAQIKILSDAVVYPLFDINQCVVRRQAVHYGHTLISSPAQYPQFTHKTYIEDNSL